MSIVKPREKRDSRGEDADAQDGNADAKLGGVFEPRRKDALFTEVGSVGGAKVAEKYRVSLHFDSAMQTGNLGIINFEIGAASNTPDGQQRLRQRTLHPERRALEYRNRDLLVRGEVKRRRLRSERALEPRGCQRPIG